MRTTLFISEKDRANFEKRCTESLITFKFLEVKDQYEVELYDAYQLYYIGQQVMLDSFRKPVAFTEEQLTQQ